MAVGNLVLNVEGLLPIGNGTNAEQWTQQTGSTPPTVHELTAHPAHKASYRGFRCRLNSLYTGLGLQVKVRWFAACGIVGNVRLVGGLRPYPLANQGFGDVVAYRPAAVTAAAPATLVVVESTLAFGTNLGGALANEPLIVAVGRDGTVGGDTLYGDIRILSITGIEG